MSLPPTAVSAAAPSGFPATPWVPDPMRLLRWLPIATAVLLLAALFVAKDLVVLIGFVSIIGIIATVDVRRGLMVLLFLLPLYRTGLGVNDGADGGAGFGVFDIYSVWFIFLFLFRVVLVDLFHIEKHHVILLGFGMLCSFLPSLSNAVEPSWAWRGYAQIFIGLLIMGGLYVRLVTLDDERFVIKLLRILTVVTAIFALQGLYMSMRYQSLMGIVGGRTYNFLFGDPNYYAGFLLMVLCISASFVLTEPHRTWRRLQMLISLILLGAIVMAMSRAGYLATVIIGLFFLWYVWRYFNIKRVIGTVVLVVAVIAGVVLFTTNLGSNIVTLITMSERVTTAVSGKDASVNQRKNIAIVGWRVAQSKPFFGVGFGNFEFAFDRFREAELSTENHEACHNTYLKIFAECGAVGLIFALVFYGALMRALFVAYLRQTDPAHRMMTFGLMVGILSYFVMNTTLDQIYEAHFWAMSGLALAYATIISRTAGQESARMSHQPSV